MSQPDAPEVEPIVERARLKVIRELLLWRARALPFLVLVAVFVVLIEPRPWRVAMLAVAGVALGIVSLGELDAIRKDAPLTRARIAQNLVVSGLSQLALVVGTGGLASPVAPGVVLVAAVFILTGPRRLATAFVLGVQVPAMWLLAYAHVSDALPGLVSFGALSLAVVSPSGALLVASFYSLIFLGTVTIGRQLRAVLDGAIEERVAEQRRLLALHEETARTLTSLSGEIAHELKNPLASIKGLAGLLRKDVTGRGAERLDVMREEIARMQGILEEFLHFSRPLVPLELRDVRLEGLLEDVVALHEAMALERRVTLTLGGGEATARLDPRKIHQVLVNLVQNAIEASPAGAEVRLSVAREGDGAVVLVEDRGRGIDPKLRAVLFEAGATTKAHGSGIGLAIARGLARQHGGELTLEDRDGGGARARLRLPLAGPALEAPGGADARAPEPSVAPRSRGGSSIHAAALTPRRDTP